MKGLNQFCDELDALIERYSQEAELPYAAIIGALFFKATQLSNEAIDNAKEEE